MKKNILAIIPARGGSKGVPGKNIKALLGKPLIEHTISFALSCGFFDKIVVSTDDDIIASFVNTKGIEVIRRPDELSKDNSLVIDAIKYTLNELTKSNYRPDYIFLLEPTSPIRSIQDAKMAKDALDNDFDSAATYCETEPSPNRIWSIENSTIKPFIDGSSPFLPRQQQSKGYKLTGQIYAFNYDSIIKEETISVLCGKTYPIITDADKAIDIDKEIDFLIAEQLIKYHEKTK